jgi:hypothetical protein
MYIASAWRNAVLGSSDIQPLALIHPEQPRWQGPPGALPSECWWQRQRPIPARPDRSRRQPVPSLAPREQDHTRKRNKTRVMSSALMISKHYPGHFRHSAGSLHMPKETPYKPKPPYGPPAPVNARPEDLSLQDGPQGIIAPTPAAHLVQRRFGRPRTPHRHRG